MSRSLSKADGAAALYFDALEPCSNQQGALNHERLRDWHDRYQVTAPQAG